MHAHVQYTLVELSSQYLIECCARLRVSCDNKHSTVCTHFIQAKSNDKRHHVAPASAIASCMTTRSTDHAMDARGQNITVSVTLSMHNET